MSASGQLLDILERPDPALGSVARAISTVFTPDPDGGITVTPKTLRTFERARERTAHTRRRIEAVDGGGRAKRELLAALAQIEAGIAQLAGAAEITFSTQQVDMLGDAARRISAGTEAINRVHRRLS